MTNPTQVILLLLLLTKSLYAQDTLAPINDFKRVEVTLDILKVPTLLTTYPRGELGARYYINRIVFLNSNLGFGFQSYSNITNAQSTTRGGYARLGVGLNVGSSKSFRFLMGYNLNYTIYHTSVEIDLYDDYWNEDYKMHYRDINRGRFFNEMYTGWRVNFGKGAKVQIFMENSLKARFGLSKKEELLNKDYVPGYGTYRPVGVFVAYNINLGLSF